MAAAGPVGWIKRRYFAFTVWLTIETNYLQTITYYRCFV
jgi:hypothetical protein